jgi:hypothetical protein
MYDGLFFFRFDVLFSSMRFDDVDVSGGGGRRATRRTAPPAATARRRNTFSSRSTTIACCTATIDTRKMPSIRTITTTVIKKGFEKKCLLSLAVVKARIECEYCEKTYANRSGLNDHVIAIHMQKTFPGEFGRQGKIKHIHAVHDSAEHRSLKPAIFVVTKKRNNINFD